MNILQVEHQWILQSRREAEENKLIFIHILPSQITF